MFNSRYIDVGAIDKYSILDYKNDIIKDIYSACEKVEDIDVDVFNIFKNNLNLIKCNYLNLKDTNITKYSQIDIVNVSIKKFINIQINHFNKIVVS
jgi:hypothetical protein